MKIQALLQRIVNVLYLLFLLSESACTTRSEEVEAFKVYHLGIGDLIDTDLYSGCLDPNAELDDRFYAYLSDAEKEDSYIQLYHSLVTARRSVRRKCTVAYSNLKGQIWGRFDEKQTLEDRKRSIRYIVNQGELDGDFGDTTEFFRKLAAPSDIDPDILSTTYVDVVRYDRSDGNLPDGVIGVMGMSKIAFDKDLRHAVLYFEYYCGHQCWRAKLLFFNRKRGNWSLYKTASVWDT